MNNKADKPGVYTNFSGLIEFRMTECEVRNASFELLDKEKDFKREIGIDILFHHGDVIKGAMWGADVKECNFLGGSLSLGVFRDGVFAGESFNSSYWFGGEWKGKKWNLSYDKFGRIRLYPPPFDNKENTTGLITEPGSYINFTGRVDFDESTFYIRNGDLELNKGKGYNIAIDCGVITNADIHGVIINYVDFNSGKIKDSIWLDGIFAGSTMQDCTWKDGTWKRGDFIDSQWEDGVWQDGYLYDGIWHKGLWEQGIWELGTWYDGEWVDGTWRSGSWDDGFWCGGDWLGGVWYGGYDKDGVYHDNDDPPNKWDI